MVTPCGEAVHAVIGANARQLEICGRFWDVPMDLVSVVIPAYNSGNGSRQRSNSVLAQSYPELPRLPMASAGTRVMTSATPSGIGTLYREGSRSGDRL